MARDRSTPGTSDLFEPLSGAPVPLPSAAKPEVRVQIVLPSNLPLALQSLDEANFNTLLRDIVAEAPGAH